MKTKILLFVILLLCFSRLTQATIVGITVSTDKPVYQVGEYVTISVTAYNPNLEPVTLRFSGRLATYIIDNTFDLADWPFFPVMSSVTIQPGTSFTWNMIHDYWPTQEYPLGMGMHTIAGQLWASELGGNNMTSPIQFEVVPEPCTVAFFSFSLALIRVFAKRNL